MCPIDLYSQRLALRERSAADHSRMADRIGSARLLVAVAGLALAGFCVAYRQPAWWLLAPLSVFAALVVRHHRIRRMQSLASRSVAFYHAGLARLAGLSTPGPGGERFDDAHHPYGADLDLFGRNGLYERLCAARTPMGEATLAHWLKFPAELDTIRARQACIGELRGRLDLREDLAVLGEPQRIALDPEALATWLDAPGELSAPWLSAAASGLTVLAGAAAIAWGLWGFAFPFLVVLAAQATLNYVVRNRVQHCLAGIEGAYEDLKLLATLLRRIETETFESPALLALVQPMTAADRPHAICASATLARLATVVNFVEARRNPFLAPLKLPLLYTLHLSDIPIGWPRRSGYRAECR